MSPLTPTQTKRLALEPDRVALVAQEGLEATLELLEALINTNTHADNAEGLAKSQALLRPRLQDLGFEVEEVRSHQPNGEQGGVVAQVRTHLWAHRRQPSFGQAPSGRRMLLLGHLDTVYPPQQPFALIKGDERWTGPGASDMKGGIATAMLTLWLLHRFEQLDKAEWTVLLVSDEEQGSPTAMPLLEQVGGQIDVALCFEAARPGGGLVVARKGVMVAKVIAWGRSGHSGIDFDRGINALSLLARVLTRAESLVSEGISVSPGGRVEVSPTAVNMIPDRASCEIEWRYQTRAQGQAVLETLQAIAQEIAAATGGRIELALRDATPPMTASNELGSLLDSYFDAAEHLGLTTEAVHTAGVGDINVVARPGVVCLDGVGPEGGGFHTLDEFVEVRSIAERAAMNTLAIATYLSQLPSQQG